MTKPISNVKFFNQETFNLNPEKWINHLKNDTRSVLQLVANYSYLSETCSDNKQTERLKIFLATKDLSEETKFFVNTFCFQSDFWYSINALDRIKNEDTKMLLSQLFLPDLLIQSLKESKIESASLPSWLSWLGKSDFSNLSTTVKGLSIEFRNKLFGDANISNLQNAKQTFFNDNSSYSNSSTNSGPLHLCAVLAVRNEGALIGPYIDDLDNYVEHFFFYLDRCTDNTREIILAKLPSNRLTIFESNNSPYRENIAYSVLFNLARSKKYRYFLKIDPDEKFSSTESLHSVLRTGTNCPNGTVVCVPWIQSSSESLQYFSSLKNIRPFSFYPVQYKEVFFVDDGGANHPLMPFHCPWYPSVGSISYRFIGTLEEQSTALLHLDKQSVSQLASYFAKTDAYTLKDLQDHSDPLRAIIKRYAPKAAAGLKDLQPNDPRIGEMYECLSRQLGETITWANDVHQRISVDPKYVPLLSINWNSLLSGR